MKKVLCIVLAVFAVLFLAGCQARYDVKNMYIVRALEIDIEPGGCILSLVALKIGEQEEYVVLSANSGGLKACFEEIARQSPSDLFYRETAAVLVCGGTAEGLREAAEVLLEEARLPESTPVYSSRRGAARAIARTKDPSDALETLEKGDGARLYSLLSQSPLQSGSLSLPHVFVGENGVETRGNESRD